MGFEVDKPRSLAWMIIPQGGTLWRKPHGSSRGHSMIENRLVCGSNPMLNSLKPEEIAVPEEIKVHELGTLSTLQHLERSPNPGTQRDLPKLLSLDDLADNQSSSLRCCSISII